MMIAVLLASFVTQGGLVCLPTVFLACGFHNLFSNVNTIWNVIYLKYFREMRSNLSYFSTVCIKIGNESHSERFNAKKLFVALHTCLLSWIVKALSPFLQLFCLVQCTHVQYVPSKAKQNGLKMYNVEQWCSTFQPRGEWSSRELVHEPDPAGRVSLQAWSTVGLAHGVNPQVWSSIPAQCYMPDPATE